MSINQADSKVASKYKFGILRFIRSLKKSKSLCSGAKIEKPTLLKKKIQANKGKENKKDIGDENENENLNLNQKIIPLESEGKITKGVGFVTGMEKNSTHISHSPLKLSEKINDNVPTSTSTSTSTHKNPPATQNLQKGQKRQKEQKRQKGKKRQKEAILGTIEEDHHNPKKRQKQNSNLKTSVQIEDKTSPNDNTCTLFVGNLNYSTTKKDIYKAFQRYGKIISISIPSLPNNKANAIPETASRGFCFVTYGSTKNAELARMAIDSSEIKGRKVSVQLTFNNTNNQ